MLLDAAQAMSLRELLRTKNLDGAVWAVSPLARAIETFMLACPDSHLLPKGAAGKSAHGKPPKVALLPQLSEHVMTPGDVGRPPSEIAKEFPEVHTIGSHFSSSFIPGHLARLCHCPNAKQPPVILFLFLQLAKEASEIGQEVWWYTKPKAPNDALAKRFNSYESKARLKARVGAFRKWALSRPEPVIVAVGHSMFWRSFLDGSRTLKNCELYTTSL
mmetsp:Transcript_5172/g.14469  ORF Transcript_5172/g.14469 Transcript_5172/m.14469 type:complete len:217 (+) Transcript_5172:854-1504(+)